MAAICEYCYRGRGYGHAVSHAKNRVNRVFRPNLQQIKVTNQGEVVRVKFCTSCIQRLKKDGHMGSYRVFGVKTAAKPKAPVVPKKSSAEAQSEIDKYLKESGIMHTAEKIKEEKKKKEKESVDIDAIVGKKK